MGETDRVSATKRPGAAVDRVINVIVTRISSGELGPGEQLRQEDLAEMLQISRVPVREALHALAEQGVLAHIKHRGFFVAKRTPVELQQIARLLEMIEEEVIAAIRWPDEETLARLRSINRNLLEICDDYDTTETFALNREFHFTIFNLSPLSLMVDELERLWRLGQPYIAAEMITSDARCRRVEEHSIVIEKLGARDREGLLAAMRQHRRRSSNRAGGNPVTGAADSPRSPRATPAVQFLSPSP